MDKKIFKNYIYSNIYQLLLVITPLITTPFLTRIMGAETLSINSWTANIVQWFVLFGIMGVNNYGNREIGRDRDNKDIVSKTFLEIFYMQIFTMVIASIIYFLYIIILDGPYKIIMMLQGITLIGVAFDITWFFYGIEDLKKATIRNVLVKVIGITLIFTFIRSSQDLMMFVLINTITGVLGQVIMWVELRKHINFVKVNFKDVIKRLKPNFALFIPQIAISVYSVLDITMLGGLYVDMRHVNFYEQSSKLVKMFMFFITSIGSVMISRVANIHAQNKHDEIEQTLTKTFSLAIYLSIPMIFGIASLIGNFISWFLPSEYYVVKNMIIAISPIILFISISNVYGIQYLVPTGMTKQYSKSVILGALVNFGINLTLIPKFGAYGAIVGTVVAEFVVTITQYLTVRNKLKVGIKFNSLFKILIASTLMYIASYNVGHLGVNIMVNLLQAFVGIIVYGLTLLVLKDKFILDIIKGVTKR